MQGSTNWCVTYFKWHYCWQRFFVWKEGKFHRRRLGIRYWLRLWKLEFCVSLLKRNFWSSKLTSGVHRRQYEGWGPSLPSGRGQSQMTFVGSRPRGCVSLHLCLSLAWCPGVALGARSAVGQSLYTLSSLPRVGELFAPLPRRPGPPLPLRSDAAAPRAARPAAPSGRVRRGAASACTPSSGVPDVSAGLVSRRPRPFFLLPGASGVRARRLLLRASPPYAQALGLRGRRACPTPFPPSVALRISAVTPPDFLSGLPPGLPASGRALSRVARRQELLLEEPVVLWRQAPGKEEEGDPVKW